MCTMCTTSYAVHVAHKTQEGTRSPEMELQVVVHQSSIFCKGTSAPKHWGAPPVLQLSLYVKYTLLGQEDELVTAMDKWNQQRAGLRKQLTLTLSCALTKLITDATSPSVILRKMTFQISQYTLHENWCSVPEFVSIALLQKDHKSTLRVCNFCIETFLILCVLCIMVLFLTLLF